MLGCIFEEHYIGCAEVLKAEKPEKIAMSYINGLQSTNTTFIQNSNTVNLYY